MEKFAPADYRTLFRLDVIKGRVTGMLSEFIMNGSLRVGNPIITFDGQWWTLRLHIASEAAVGEKGLELFRDKDAYDDYAKKFRAYIAEARQGIVEKYADADGDISAGEFAVLAEKLQKFWYYYGLTEFIYHDKAHAVMLETKDAVLEQNLADLEKLKFEGRDLLNSFLLEDGTLNNIIKRIAKQCLDGDMVCKYCYLSELEALLAGKAIDLEAVRQRQSAFVLASASEGIRHIENPEAKEIADEFKAFEEAQFKKAAQGLKGQTANKGKVSGTVVISPMLDLKAAKEVEKRMKPGDILVVQSTNPDLMALCNKAGAIVTDQGGMLSHAAIISRELDVPCIVGTVDGTKVFKDGDFVEVDATNGVIRIIEQPAR